MYTLSISIGPVATWMLHFKTIEAATAAQQKITSPGTGGVGSAVNITDDYGAVFVGSLPQIHGSIMESLEASNRLRGDKWVDEQRAQARAMSAARNDPVIKAIGAFNGGMMPGMMPNQ